MAITALGLALVAGFVLRAVGPDDRGPTLVVPEYEGGSVQEFSPTVDVTGTELDPLDPDASDIAADPMVGMPAPVITGENFTGEWVTTPVDGDATILVFLAHWCPHCQAEFPRLLDAWIDPDLPNGVEVVAVPTAQRDDSPNWPPSDWMLEGPRSWDEPVLLDTADQDVARAMGVTSYPFFVVIAPDGTVAARTAGEQGVDGLAAMVEFAAGLG